MNLNQAIDHAVEQYGFPYSDRWVATALFENRPDGGLEAACAGLLAYKQGITDWKAADQLLQELSEAERLQLEYEVSPEEALRRMLTLAIEENWLYEAEALGVKTYLLREDNPVATFLRARARALANHEGDIWDLLEEENEDDNAPEYCASAELDSSEETEPDISLDELKLICEQTESHLLRCCFSIFVYWRRQNRKESELYQFIDEMEKELRPLQKRAITQRVQVGATLCITARALGIRPAELLDMSEINNYDAWRGICRLLKHRKVPRNDGFLGKGRPLAMPESVPEEILPRIQDFVMTGNCSGLNVLPENSQVERQADGRISNQDEQHSMPGTQIIRLNRSVKKLLQEAKFPDSDKEKRRLAEAVEQDLQKIEELASRLRQVQERLESSVP